MCFKYTNIFVEDIIKQNINVHFNISWTYTHKDTDVLMSLKLSSQRC